MKFLIYGAGATGAYLGGSLRRAGHAATFLVRPATAERLRATGLRLLIGAERIDIHDLSLTTSPAEALSSDSFDCILFALKAFDTVAALDELRAATAGPPPILCLQNGVENELEMGRLFGPARVIAGTLTTAVSKSGAGEVAVERKRGLGVALGHPLSEALVDVFNAAGLNARAFAKRAAGPMKWSKLLANLVGNATSAILDLSVARLFDDPRLFTVEVTMLRECLAVMRALNYPAVDLPGTPVRALALGVRLPNVIAQPLLKRGLTTGRGGKMPSFHIDLHSRRGQTEVRWLNGAVVRYGEQCGVPTPVNRILTETLEALTEGRLRLEDFQRKPEALLNLING
jgi:2-dehydropantoate 2-reductase